MKCRPFRIRKLTYTSSPLNVLLKLLLQWNQHYAMQAFWTQCKNSRFADSLHIDRCFYQKLSLPVSVSPRDKRQFHFLSEWLHVTCWHLVGVPGNEASCLHKFIFSHPARRRWLWVTQCKLVRRGWLLVDIREQTRRSSKPHCPATMTAAWLVFLWGRGGESGDRKQIWFWSTKSIRQYYHSGHIWDFFCQLQ